MNVGHLFLLIRNLNVFTSLHNVWKDTLMVYTHPTSKTTYEARNGPCLALARRASQSVFFAYDGPHWSDLGLHLDHLGAGHRSS